MRIIVPIRKSIYPSAPDIMYMYLGLLDFPSKSSFSSDRDVIEFMSPKPKTLNNLVTRIILFACFITTNIWLNKFNNVKNNIFYICCMPQIS